jgi:hypothetical protein
MRKIIRWVSVVVGALVSHAWGQEMPPRDVAVLVDVSASVKNQKWRDTDKLLVKRMITGLKASHYGRDWTLDGEPFFREGTPLMDEGNSLFIMKFGDYLTTLQGVAIRQPETIAEYPRGVDNYFTRHYPSMANNEFNDGHTHLDLAKAVAYKKMDKRRGYYMIIVSDEEPDPERALEPTEEDLVNTWTRAADVWPVAVLSRQGSALKVTLRAVGFDPDPAKRPVKDPPEVTTVEPEPPAELSIEFLGDLRRASTADQAHRPLTDPPYFAWQIPYETERNRKFQVKIRGVEEQQGFQPEALSTTKAHLVYDKERLQPGKYQLQVTSAGLKSPEVYFEIKRPWDYLPIIALLTGILTVVVFLSAWWTLRRGN